MLKSGGKWGLVVESGKKSSSFVIPVNVNRSECLISLENMNVR